jgi:predicted acyltransferase
MASVSEPALAVPRPSLHEGSSAAAKRASDEQLTPGLRSSHDRLVSIDAGRGFAILYSIAAIPLVPALVKIRGSTLAASLAAQLSHSTWHGMTVNDFGFPGFLMIMGISLTLSLEKYRGQSIDRRRLVLRLLARCAVLFIVGVVWSGGMAHPWPDVPLAGPLQRLAVCCFITGCLCLVADAWYLAVIAVAVVATYGLAMQFVTVHGFGGGDYSIDGNLAAYIDSKLLPGRKTYTTWDPDGVWTTAPALALCVFGALLGRILVSRRMKELPRNILFLVIGALALAAGFALSSTVPVNRFMWTSSFALLSAGWAVLSLPVVHQVIDVWKYEKWTFPFVVAGRNALFGFVVIPLLPLDSVATRIAGGDVASVFGQFGPLFLVAIQLALGWLVLYWMYNRRIFLRL